MPFVIVKGADILEYVIRVMDTESSVSIEPDTDNVRYLKATGQRINGFYHDLYTHNTHWYYAGKEYSDTHFYARMLIAADGSGFCGYDAKCTTVDMFDAEGKLIMRYHVGDDVAFPLSLDVDMINYVFRTFDSIWWIYKGRRIFIPASSAVSKVVTDFHSGLYIKEMTKLHDILYSADGRLIYTTDKFPPSLTFDGTGEQLHGDIRPVLLERYGLVAVCRQSEQRISSITLYDFNGHPMADMLLPHGNTAFHSIKLLEHTDIPVIFCCDDDMKISAYELLPSDNGELALYPLDITDRGFSVIDDTSFEDKHEQLWRRR